MLNIETVITKLRLGECLMLQAQDYTFNEVALMYKLVSHPEQLTVYFADHLFSQDEVVALINAAPAGKVKLDFSATGLC